MDKNAKKKPLASDEIKKIVGKVIKEDCGPVIVFSFSKAECETHAMSLRQLDFTSEDEKKAIKMVYTNAMSTLSEEDQ